MNQELNQANDGGPAEKPATVSTRRQDGRTRTLKRAGAYAVVLGVTVAAVYYATRENAAPKSMAPSKSDGGAAAGANTGQPIALTPSEAQRIGVTYAVATIGPIGKEVRTVGQVTFDETRVQTITLKFDGWVDQLIVNATGQRVAQGQPLLTIYSPMLVTAQ